MVGVSPGAPPAERAAAFGTYIAYFGAYTIDVDKRTVTHHVEGAMNPNMVGSDLEFVAWLRAES